MVGPARVCTMTAGNVGGGKPDPSHPVSVKLQKWLLFSLCLASLGVGTDLVAAALNAERFTPVGILGKGELYMVSIGMLFSAAGELLYDRTRLESSGAWQVSVAFVTLIAATLIAAIYGYAKAGHSQEASIALYSVVSIGLSLCWGLLVVVLAGLSGRPQ
ncbi:hypothetical protein AB0F72_21580 [Actinoplanes sp. NPDC023936]|uniref:hypothetical protein n=1 Tax=Actinoplanes sp. NPDC023936 TaxID=3154910 RepID=UPI0033D1546C